MIIYQEYQPPLCLKPYIKCYWIMKSEVLPDSTFGQRLLTESLEFTFNLAAPVEFVSSDGLVNPLLSTGITGPLLRPMRLKATGRVDLFGICFRPGGSSPFLKTPAHTLVDQYADPEDVCRAGISQIIEYIHNICLTTSSRIATINACLLNRLPKSQTDDNTITLAIETIEYYNGQIAIARLSHYLGMSRRNLDRRFKERLGLTPKQFCRNLRFKNAYKNMETSPHIDLADVAISSGYYDQAHLINEFKHFTGTSPLKYFTLNSCVQDFFTTNF